MRWMLLAAALVAAGCGIGFDETTTDDGKGTTALSEQWQPSTLGPHGPMPTVQTTDGGTRD